MVNRRSRFWINKQVQLGYIKFLFLFWFISVAVSIICFVGLLVLQLKSSDSNELALLLIKHYEQNYMQIGFFLLLHLLISSIFGFYLFRSFSHRVCGPIYNIENYIKQLNDSEQPAEFSKIEIRKDDYFQSLADQLNKFFMNKK
jgi:hypothetical protein